MVTRRDWCFYVGGAVLALSAVLVLQVAEAVRGDE